MILNVGEKCTGEICSLLVRDIVAVEKFDFSQCSDEHASKHHRFCHRFFSLSFLLGLPTMNMLKESHAKIECEDDVKKNGVVGLHRPRTRVFFMSSWVGLKVALAHY